MKFLENRVEDLENSKKGITRVSTVLNNYVRLFTVHFKNIWKSNTTTFKLDDTQGGHFSILVNLVVSKENPDLKVTSFRYMQLSSTNSLSNLIAVVTGSNTVEVFYQMGSGQSPTLNILSNAQLTKNDDYSYIETDCQTVVETLPEGTQYLATDMLNKEIFGTISNPDATKFEIVSQRIIQKGNIVSVDLNIKLLEDIPINSQFNFKISKVDRPVMAFYPSGTYGLTLYNANNILYVGVFTDGNIWIANKQTANKAEGIWKIHFCYVV